MNAAWNRRTWITAAAATTLGSIAALARAAPKERVIHVVAKKFVFVPNEIRVRTGEAVVLMLSAPEVPMGFSVPGLALRADVVPGKVTALRLTADKAGSFAFLCDVFCGTGHEEMSGVLVVS